MSIAHLDRSHDETERAIVEWCGHKPPIRPEACRDFRARACYWPKADGGLLCLAFTGRSPDGQPKALVLVRPNGQEFPLVGTLGPRKAHTIGGSTESWLWPGGPEALAGTQVVVKCEGLPDALALHGAGLPAGWLVVSNACGAHPGRGLDFGWAAGKKAVVVPDADKSGQEGAEVFGQRFRHVGAADVQLVGLPYPIAPDHGRDLRDWLNEGHTAADFLGLVEKASPWNPARPQGLPEARPIIVVSTDAMPLVDAAVDALAKRPEVFQRAGMLVQIVKGAKAPSGLQRAPDCPTIAMMKPARLRELLSAAASWQAPTGKDDALEPCLPPAWAVAAVDARGQWEPIRLEYMGDNPEERTDFQHPDLIAWCQAERPRLVVAALTILQAFCAAGRPDMGLKPWGSYEGWSGLVRQAVAWVGLSDPAGERMELLQQADVERQALGQALRAWTDFDPDHEGYTARQLLLYLGDHAKDHPALVDALCNLCPTKDGKLPTVRSLGNKLRRVRRRVVEQRYFDSREYTEGVQVWTVNVVGTTGSTGSSGSMDHP